MRGSPCQRSVDATSPNTMPRPDAAQDLAAAGVIGRIVAERLGRAARPRASAWIMRYGVQGSALPGLSTSGIFSTIAGTHSEWTPGELLGSTTPSESPRGKKLIARPRDHADAGVEQRQIEAARQAAEHLVDLRQHAADLVHVAAHQDVRHAGGGGQLADVVVRRLRDAGERIERQRAARGTARRRACDIATSSRDESARAPRARRPDRSRSRRISPRLAWLTSTNGSRVR